METLKSILRTQVFGVELEQDAVDLTAFSLALAVCDSLQPHVIWSQLRFDPLRPTNLRVGDFFEVSAEASTSNYFDVIVGNPPFESKFTEAAKRINAARVAERGRIPDKQIAYLFLDHCLHMLTPRGRLCLIQPSSFLYNLQSHSFRRSVAATGRLEAVFDFTSIRGLYEGADPKTIAVLVGTQKASRFAHLTFRRTSMYCRLLGSLYNNLRANEPVLLDGLICQPFFFGKEPTLAWLGSDCGEALKGLIFEQTLPSLRTVRVVRFYHENVILIIKPDRLRYWIRSTAIRDADDTLVELRDQGY